MTDIKLNGSASAAVHITYDQLSLRKGLTLANGASTTYTRQLNGDLSQLIQAFVGASVTFTYGFNKVNQETTRSVSDSTFLWHPTAASNTSYGVANSVNEYPAVGGASYQYDANGNLKNDGLWSYVYDTENHLLTATKAGTAAAYVYDGLHRQVQKSVGAVKTRYVYAGWQRLADYDGTSGSLQQRYVYGTNLTDLLLEVDSTGLVTYVHCDRTYSPIALTGTSGVINNRYAYSPYGDSGPMAGISIGFSGMRYDAETNLYYCNRRYYSPACGRFLQPDPAGFQDSLNLYTYVGNDPLDLIDELGQYVTGTYDVSNHHLHLTDENGNEFDSSDIFSGNGRWKNDPTQSGVEDHGPIPPGLGFNIQPKIRIQKYPNKFEYPLQVARGITKRHDFTLHPGSQSNGCITFNSDEPMEDKDGNKNPKYPHNNDFDRLEKFLDKQTRKNGNIGRLDVVSGTLVNKSGYWF